MANLSKAAKRLLEDAGCTEVADDYIVLFNSDVRVLLSHRAVSDLNQQAREAAIVGMKYCGASRDCPHKVMPEAVPVQQDTSPASLTNEGDTAQSENKT